MAIIDLRACLGAAIKSERSARRISQEELAYRAGLHRTYISDVERGTRNLSIETIGRLARALDISVPMLFERANGESLAKRPIEILLVEDKPRDIRLTLGAFKKAKVTNPIYVTRGRVEALDFIFATARYRHRRDLRPPQIVLLELNLPEKSSLEILRQIKANETCSGIFVIILTTSNRDRRISDCRRLGAASHMAKPFKFHNFCQVVADLNLGWTLVRSETRTTRHN
jgi:transcriptional regulator with XRE-family HTH domain